MQPMRTSVVSPQSDTKHVSAIPASCGVGEMSVKLIKGLEVYLRSYISGSTLEARHPSILGLYLLQSALNAPLRLSIFGHDLCRHFWLLLPNFQLQQLARCGPLRSFLCFITGLMQFPFSLSNLNRIVSRFLKETRNKKKNEEEEEESTSVKH